MRSTFKVLFYVNGSNESFKKRIGIDRAASSYKVRIRSRNHLAAFIKKCYKRNNISMLELTPDFIKEYEIYLSTDDIVAFNGEKWILSKRHKTKVNSQVKLLDIQLQIIRRYERFQEDKLVFPNLNYWNICKPLKKTMNGINLLISLGSEAPMNRILS